MNDDNRTEPYPDLSIEHPTLVIPGSADAAASAPKPKRKRWPWIVGGVVVVLIVLVVAAELIARAVLPGIARGIVIEQLDLPADQQLDVQAEGILLPQLIAGNLTELKLSTDAVTIGEITGAVDVTALGVPLRGGDLESASGTVRIDQEQFEALLGQTDLPIDSLEFDAPDVTATGSVALLGVSLPLALTATPGAEAGELTLTPVALRIGGVELNASEVADRLGDLGTRLTETQHICIADQLPAGLTLTGLTIEGTAAVIDLSVAGGIVSDPALQENGVCE
ncbi:MAG TPA: LmeA family phospholipid-binding protein [Microbacterium sp.]|nr:LmeA family phospholipid-binding protein [Microbacterium sp.]